MSIETILFDLLIYGVIAALIGFMLWENRT